MKRTLYVTLFFCISALFFSGCGENAAGKTEAVDVEKIKPTIQAMEDAYAAAEKAKNVDGVLVYYADDAISYSRNQEPASGKVAIKASIEKRLAEDSAASSNNSVYKIVDLFAEGDMLVEIGSWSTLNAAGSEVNRGHYMSYFQKRDGKYVCVRDMNVSSLPVKQ